MFYTYLIVSTCTKVILIIPLSKLKTKRWFKSRNLNIDGSNIYHGVIPIKRHMKKKQAVLQNF